MPMLGDILAAARNSSGAFHTWLERSNPQFADQIARAAAASGITPTSYVRAAISDFNRFAPEEDWATLTSSLRASDDPGTVCLHAMVDWRLNAVACDGHSHWSLVRSPRESHGQE